MKVLFNLRAISYDYGGEKHNDFALMGDDVIKRFSPELIVKSPYTITKPELFDGDEKCVISSNDETQGSELSNVILSEADKCQEMQDLDKVSFEPTGYIRFSGYKKINDLFRSENAEILKDSTMVVFGKVIGYIDRPFEEVVECLKKPEGQVIDLRRSNLKGYIL